MRQIKTVADINLDNKKIYLFMTSSEDFYWWYSWCPERKGWFYNLNFKVQGFMSIDSDKEFKDCIICHLNSDMDIFELDTIENIDKLRVLQKLRK